MCWKSHDSTLKDAQFFANRVTPVSTLFTVLDAVERLASRGVRVLALSSAGLLRKGQERERETSSTVFDFETQTRLRERERERERERARTAPHTLKNLACFFRERTLAARVYSAVRRDLPPDVECRSFGCSRESCKGTPENVSSIYPIWKTSDSSNALERSI